MSHEECVRIVAQVGKQFMDLPPEQAAQLIDQQLADDEKTPPP
jgi:hypothetical protein